MLIQLGSQRLGTVGCRQLGGATSGRYVSHPRSLLSVAALGATSSCARSDLTPVGHSDPARG
jgi:hypothetical protein